MRVKYQMDDASPAPVVISSEAFLTLKRLNNELEEVIETIEILNSPQLMKQIERSKKDVKAGRVCELSGADDLDSIWK
jgi:PHD/YefM family antitoxin component YafN of YafNO toxin-antitoxin module